MRIAGAPITWGVCEVPGWGHQLEPDRVLAEMRAAGLTATELGPDGYLPADPEALRAVLGRHDLSLVAGFVPVVLHDPDRWDAERAELERQLELLARGGAGFVVLAAATGVEGYESTPELDDAAWKTLGAALDEASALAGEHGLTATLHPHYGTVVETPEQTARYLAESSVPLCLDTGHVMVGGGDPVALAREAADRVRHVHLKDVRSDLAERVRAGGLSYHGAVSEGMYVPLGEGDLDVAAIVSALQGAGYDGWYVLEQDTVLSGEPPPGAGPADAAARSRAHLERLA